MANGSPSVPGRRAIRRGLTASLFAALLSLAACNHSIVQKPEPELRLAVDTRDPILQLPVYVAMHERMFASRRLRISLVDRADAGSTSEALLNGSCQLAASGFEQVLEAHTEGRSLKAFALVARSPMLSLIANGAIRGRRQPAFDPRRGRVATGPAGGVWDLFARFALGAGTHDIETAPEQSMADIARAFERRKAPVAVVDAVTLASLDLHSVPYQPLVDTRTLAGLLETYGVSSYPALCLYADAGWLAENAERAERITTALAAAVGWIRSHKGTELVPLLPEAYRRSVDADALAMAVEQARPLFARDPALTADGVDAARRVLAASMERFRGSSVPPTTYTNDYVAGAHR